MNAIEVFQHWFEHEKVGNRRMVEMIASVPDEKQDSAEFKRALNLAAHIVACRSNWIARIKGNEAGVGDWWPTAKTVAELEPKLAQMEAEWTQFLADMTEAEFDRDFEYVLGDGRRVRWNVRGQLMQMVGHAFYHRGQIALLVDNLGGSTVDTDYLYWVMKMDPQYGVIKS